MQSRRGNIVVSFRKTYFTYVKNKPVFMIWWL